MNNIKAIISLGYKDIFDDYNTVDIAGLLRDIPSKKSLDIICRFLVQIHTSEREMQYQLDILKEWLGRMPLEIKERTVKVVNNILSNPIADVNFINNFSGLVFIDNILKNYNQTSTDENLTPEQELKLFKAYLWCSQLWIDKQHKVIPAYGASTLDEFLRVSLPIQVQQTEIIEFKDFRLQFIKVIRFFKFCEKDVDFQKFLDIFLKENKVSTWREYLRNVISGYIRDLTPPNIPSIMSISDEHKDFKNWMEGYCIEPALYKSTDDFQQIREKPLFKLDDDKYLFLNLNFFIDKFFQGVQFDFAKALISQKTSYNGKVIKENLDFKQVYNEKFSERGLFYEVIKYVFEKNKYTKFSGVEMHSYLNEGEPDFYMRDTAKIYLFEYKDVILSAKSKYSFDYEKIREEIFLKMVKNQGGKQKGVTQLVNSIETIAKGEYAKFDKFDHEKAIIYPILVYNDVSFSIPGINYILNEEFNKQIEAKKLNQIFEIKDLILIDIDCLIKFQDLFREKKLKINNCFNGYLEYIGSKNILKKITTYSQYLHEYIGKLNYNSPKLLMDEIRQILPSS